MKRNICGRARFQVDLQCCGHSLKFLKVAVLKIFESSRKSTEMLVV